MIKNFLQMKEHIKSLKGANKKIAVVCADDEDVLLALEETRKDNIAEGILVGNTRNIKAIAEKLNISLDNYQIIEESCEEKCAQICTTLVREKQASVIMKGSIDSSKYMKAILNKEKGLNSSGNLLSLVGVFECESYHKFLLITDPGINIAPNLQQKVKIIENAVKVAHGLGISTPLVACCAAIEKVNYEAMPATTDAACLAKMSERGQIKGCIIDGPLGLDNAISKQSAQIKKINSPVAGNADIILCNDIESGNYLYKSLVFLAKAKNATVVMGADAPVILTSRADSHETKYLSIGLSLLCCKH